jgi:hypothetical protein
MSFALVYFCKKNCKYIQEQICEVNSISYVIPHQILYIRYGSYWELYVYNTLGVKSNNILRFTYCPLTYMPLSSWYIRKIAHNAEPNLDDLGYMNIKTYCTTIHAYSAFNNDTAKTICFIIYADFETFIIINTLLFTNTLSQSHKVHVLVDILDIIRQNKQIYSVLLSLYSLNPLIKPLPANIKYLNGTCNF